MWSIPASILAVGLASAIFGTCAFGEQNRADAERNVDRVVTLCEEISLPNSMARSPGFDINAHLAALAREREATTASLRTPAGVLAAQRRLSSEPDEIRRHCLEQILAEISHP